MIDNVVTSEVNALMYFVLSKAEKRVSYGELVCTTEVLRYSQGVAQTEVVKTEFDCNYNEYMKIHNMNT
jgi:hypothetical protein